MTARKLRRRAGLVFVLAALVGGIGTAAAVAEHGAGGTGVAQASKQAGATSIDIIWN